MKDINPQIQELEISNGINTKKTTPGHLIVKLQETIPRKRN